MQRVLETGDDYVKLAVDESIYSLTTVYAAGYVFLDRVYIYLDKDSKEKIVIWLFPKDKKEDLESLGMDFFNELLNYSHYFSSLKANAEVLKLLMQRALFSATPSLVNDVSRNEVKNFIEDSEGKQMARKAQKKK